jgi:hypothetical protein
MFTKVLVAYDGSTAALKAFALAGINCYSKRITACRRSFMPADTS